MNMNRASIALSFAAAALVVAGFAANGDAAKKKAVPANPTYAEHIAPIINDHCVQCHRPGEVAPFSLLGYENAKKWATMISTVTHAKQMPPWKAVEGYGEFQDVNTLAPEEIETLKRWDANGAPRGDKKKEPAEPKFSSAWALGNPDMIIQAKEPYKISAEGTDEYRNFVIPTNFKEARYVTAMDVKPGNARVVHHVICFLDTKGAAAKLEAKNHDGQAGYETFGGVGFLPDGSLGGWAPGFRARIAPTGRAFRVEPGTTIVLQVHYNKSGKPETDQTKVGLYFAKEPVKQEMQIAWLFNPLLSIPADAAAHKATYVRPIQSDITIWGVMPHMHLLGKSMKAWVEKPDGTKVPLIYVDNWDFNWQLGYAFKEPVKVSKGSKIVVESIYDNSAKNPRNPTNPPKRVNVGEKTTDEMMLLVAVYTVDGLAARPTNLKMDGLP